MNSTNIAENIPSTVEETYNELMHYIDLLEPLLLQLETPNMMEKKTKNHLWL
jgi:hypothetical protein